MDPFNSHFIQNQAQWSCGRRKRYFAIGQFGIGVINISQFGVGLFSLSQFTIAGYAMAQFTLAYSCIAQFGIYIHDGWGQHVLGLPKLLGGC